MKIRTYYLIQAVVITTAIGLTAPTAQAGDPAVARQHGGSTVTIVERSAFDWADAGVGAVGAFGLMLVASGLVIVRRHSPAGGQRSGARHG
jgi:hypothetical protein